MRIRPSKNPPPYLNRRDQLRMLGMVGTLCIVVIAIRFAEKPSSWYWLTGRPKESATANGETKHLSERDIDWSIRDGKKRPLKPGEFLSKPESETKSSEASTPQVSSTVPKSASEPRVEIDPDILADVEDNTLGIRRGETPAYYYLLAKTRDTPLSYFERAARKDVSFLVLMAESERFRGDLITIEGRLKRLVPFEASTNPAGIEQLYEAWIFTEDSGKNPYRVVCTEIPKGVPQGEDITNTVTVRVSGYFFKRFGYAAQHGLHIAPLLIAKRLRWFPPRTQQAEDAGLIPYLVGFMVFVAGTIGITLWRFTVSDTQFQQQHLTRITEAPREAIAALDGIETADISEMFRQLAESDSDINEGNGRRRSVQRAGRGAVENQRLVARTTTKVVRVAPATIGRIIRSQNAL